MDSKNNTGNQQASVGGISFDDLFCCRDWAYGNMIDKRLPTKEQFIALQNCNYIPKTYLAHGGEHKIDYGHYGWAVDYDWTMLRNKILKDAPPLSAKELKKFHWISFLRIPVGRDAEIELFTRGEIDNRAIDKMIETLKLVKDSEHFEAT